MSGAIALALTCTGVTAFADSRTPDPYGQNMDYWCWVASAKIVGENNGGVNTSIDRTPKLLPDTNDQGLHNPYYGYYYQGSTKKFTADGLQYAIVKHVKGNTGNNGSTDSEKHRALQFASGDEMSVGTKGSYKYVFSDALIDEIQTELEQDRYIIGNMCDANYTNGHSIVIKDYNSYNDKYFIFDPWDKSEVWVEGYDLFESYGYEYLSNSWGRVSWFQYCR